MREETAKQMRNKAENPRILRVRKIRRKNCSFEILDDAFRGALAGSRQGRLAQLQGIVDESRRVHAARVDPPYRHSGGDRETNDFGGTSDAAFAIAIPNRDQEVAIAHHETSDFPVALVLQRPASAVHFEHFSASQQGPEGIDGLGEILLVFALRKRQRCMKLITRVCTENLNPDVVMVKPAKNRV